MGNSSCLLVFTDMRTDTQPKPSVSDCLQRALVEMSVLCLLYRRFPHIPHILTERFVVAIALATKSMDFSR